MKSIRAKLGSSSGASLVYAVIFMLVCLTVGAVVLTAAASNAGRMSHQRAAQQDYLTTSSAARLLRAELEGLRFAGREQRRHDGGTGAVTEEVLSPEDNASGALTAQVSAMAAAVFQTQTVYAVPSGTLPGSLTMTVTVPEFDEVTAVLSMDGDYQITVTLSFSDGRGTHPLTLTLPAYVDEQTVTTVTSYEVSYTDMVDIDGVPTPVTYYDTYYITTTVRTVSVSWDGGTIAKGD